MVLLELLTLLALLFWNGLYVGISIAVDTSCSIPTELLALLALLALSSCSIPIWNGLYVGISIAVDTSCSIPTELLTLLFWNGLWVGSISTAGSACCWFCCSRFPPF